MVLISITSDPNDFLTAPHPVLYNRGSNNGAKPVQNNWSNGATAAEGGEAGLAKTETTPGQDHVNNVNVNQPAPPDLVYIKLK